MNIQYTERGFKYEKRMTFRLLSYWSRIKGEREMPGLEDVNISELESLYHHTFTVKIGLSDADHSISYFGPELADLYNCDYTGYTLSEAMQDSVINNTIGFYDKVLESRKPASESSDFFLDGHEIKYRSIILPLSSSGAHIDFLIGTTNYQIL